MEPSIRILRILTRFNIGGPIHNVLNLSKYLPDYFQTKLIGGIKDPCEGDATYLLDQQKIDYSIISSLKRTPNIYNDYKSYLEIKKIIKQFKPHIVHTHTSKAGVIGRLAAIHSQTPLIFHTYHGNIFNNYFTPLKSFFFKQIDKYLAEKTQQIIAISKQQKEELYLKYRIAKKDKISVVPLGFELSKFSENLETKRKIFRQKYTLKPNTIAIGIIGRLTAIKNQKLFIDAIIKVKKKTEKDIKAFLIGDGEDYEKLKKYLHTKEIDPELFVFTSWIKAIDSCIAGLDIVCLTSLNEGTPVSLIEASAAKKPVLSTPTSSIQSIITQNKTGYYTDSFSSEEFSDKLLKLIENDLLRKKLGTQGYKHVINNFDIKILIKNITHLYLQYI